jgi:hypothetical protein
MLVTRQCEIGRNTWSSISLETGCKDVASPRMSNFEALSTQPDWREQYSPYPLSGENGILQPQFEQPASSGVPENNQSQQQSGAVPHLKNQRSLDPVQQDPQSSTLAAQLDVPPIDPDQINNPTRNDSLVASKPRSHSVATVGSNQLDPVSTTPPQQGPLANDEGAECHLELKEEDDELEDDEMLDAEDATAAPGTAAERRAERRKMKRFRYNPDTTLVYVPLA